MSFACNRLQVAVEENLGSTELNKLIRSQFFTMHTQIFDLKAAYDGMRVRSNQLEAVIRFHNRQDLLLEEYNVSTHGPLHTPVARVESNSPTY